MDTLILGCTHYPLLADVIGDFMQGVTLIDSGAEAANAARTQVEQGAGTGGSRSISFRTTRRALPSLPAYFCSSRPQGRRSLGPTVLTGHPAPAVRRRTENGNDMKKDVWLSICSTQQFADCEEEQIDLVTRGHACTSADGKYYIAYEESELTGLEGTRDHRQAGWETTVSLMRGRGPTRSHMLFSEDERHIGLYQTPVGTEHGDCDAYLPASATRMGENGGELVIDYTIEVDQFGHGGSIHFEMMVTTTRGDKDDKTVTESE